MVWRGRQRGRPVVGLQDEDERAWRRRRSLFGRQHAFSSLAAWKKPRGHPHTRSARASQLVCPRVARFSWQRGLSVAASDDEQNGASALRSQQCCWIAKEGHVDSVEPASDARTAHTTGHCGLGHTNAESGFITTLPRTPPENVPCSQVASTLDGCRFAAAIGKKA